MNEPLHERLMREIPERLAQALGVPIHEVKAFPGLRVGSSAADLLVTLPQGDFIVECKTTADTKEILPAIRLLQQIASQLGKKAFPVVAVPYMGKTGRRVCDEAHVNWLDLSGNAHLQTQRFRVHLEGKSNRFAKRGRPSSFFAPKSARITRWLLIHADRFVTQRELAKATEMDEGFTSRIVKRMEEAELLLRDSTGAIRARNFNTLLSAWREAYDFSRHSIIRGHIAARSSDEALQELAKQFEHSGLRHAATGLAGAWLWSHFAGFRLTTIYVAQRPVDSVLVKIGFREEERGENIWLVVPNDEGVFQGTSRQEGVMCAHPVQVYLDLKGHPERSAEAAEKLRSEYLKEPTRA